MGIGLPLVLYAASRAYRTRQDEKDRKARLEAESTITNYGYSVDASGQRVGGMRKLLPTDENVEATHFRIGSGNLQKIENDGTAVPYYIDKTTGVKGTAADFSNRQVDIMKNRSNYTVVGHKKTDGTISMFPSWDKLVNFTKSQDQFEESIIYSDADDVEYPNVAALTTGVRDKVKKDPNYPVYGLRTIKSTDTDGKTTFKYANVPESTFKAIGTVANADKFAVSLVGAEDKISDFNVVASSPREELNLFTNKISKFLSAGGTHQDFAAQFTRESYTQGLNWAARTILDKAAQNSKDQLQDINTMLRTNPAEFLKGRYNTLSKLPGMIETLSAAVGTQQIGQRDAILDKIYKENGGTPESINIAEVTQSLPVDDGDGQEIQTEAVTFVPQPAQYNGFAASMEAAVIPNGSPDAKENLMNFINQDLFQYKEVETVAQDGRIIKKQLLSESQPKVDFFVDLQNRQYGPPDNQKSGLNILIDAFKIGKATYSTVEKQILREYFDTLPNMDMAIRGIAAMTSSNGEMAAEIEYRRLAQDKDFSKFKSAETQRAVALNTAADSITKFAATMRDSNGNIIPFSSAQGQVFLTVEGMKYFVSDVLPEATKRMLGMGDQKRGTIFTTGANRLYESTRRDLFANTGYKIPGGFKLTRDADVATIAELAAEKGMSVSNYMDREAAARQELMGMFEKETQASNADIKSNLVMRSYYKFTSAYLLAAAIQGGTGGRTISDQDVLNILKAFGDDKFFQEPELQERLLLNIAADLDEQAKYSNIFATGSPTEQFAALKYTGMTTSLGVRNSLTTKTVQQAIERAGFNARQDLEFEKQTQGQFNGFTIEQIIAKANKTREMIGAVDEPYTPQNLPQSSPEFKNALKDLITQRNRNKR